MIKVCNEYLENLLKLVGCKFVFKDLKSLETSKATNLGAVLFQDEILERMKKKKTFIRSEDGKKVTRVQFFQRIITISVVIGEGTYEKCESIFSEFLSNLNPSIDDGNGNAIKIDVGESDWVEEKDSILNAKIAVQLEIKLTGGIYKDFEWSQLSEIQVECEGM